MENTIDRTLLSKKLFLEAYPEAFTINEACKVAGVSRQTFYLWMEKDPEFAQGFEQAKKAAGELLEKHARDRATSGKSPSDILLMFLLKGIYPQKYRDNSQVEVVGKGGKDFFNVLERLRGLDSDTVPNQLSNGTKLIGNTDGKLLEQPQDSK